MRPMRRGLGLVLLLLPLSGCYVEPPVSGYAQPGYPPPGYPPPGYPPPGYPQPGYPPPGYSPPGYPPGYAPPPYDAYAGAYPGYSYNNGVPTILDGGIAMPLVLFGGEWGYYDRDRHWHRAPEGVARDLEAHRAGGFRPDGAPRGEPPRPGQPAGPAAFRPGEQPRPGPPGGPPGLRPGEQPRSAPAQPEGSRGRDQPQDSRGRRSPNVAANARRANIADHKPGAGDAQLA